MNEDALFANVDLEMECEEDLQRFIENLGNDVSVQYHGRLENGKDFVSLALRDTESGIYGEPDQTVLAFCDLIEKLEGESKRIWCRCDKREFDIGFESGNNEKTCKARLDNSTLTRVAKLGATIEITIYPVAKD